MSTINEWRGDAPAVKQLDTVTVAGAATSTATAWAEINGKRVTAVVTNADPAATVAANLYAACAAADIPEFLALDFVYVDLAATFTAAGKTAGVPFVMTVGDTATGTAVTSATTTAATGPNDAASGANWTLGTKPGTTANEEIVIRRGPALLYNLLTAFAGPVDRVRHFATHTAGVGLPAVNLSGGGDGYREYLFTHLFVSTTTEVWAGEGEGDGPAIFNVQMTAAAGHQCVVRRSGGVRQDGTPAVDVWATNAGVKVFAFGGTVGYGVNSPVTVQAAEFHTANDAEAQAYSPVATSYVRGGRLTTRAAVADTVQSGGEWLHENGTLATIKATGGIARLTHQQGGSIHVEFQAAANTDPPVLDLSANTLATRTIDGTSYFKGGAQLLDPFFTANLTTVEFDRASFQASDVGDKFKITRAAA